jgi:hypothetical protein
MENEIRSSILEPRRNELVDALKKVVTGEEPSYIFDYAKEKHYQIWFYNPLDLNYIFIGDNNFVVNISKKDDEFQLQEFRKTYELLNHEAGNLRPDFSDILREIEFEFFSDCWHDLETQLSTKLRCFLIEYGIIRGLDVNNRTRIDGEKIGDVLRNESY